MSVAPTPFPLGLLSSDEVSGAETAKYVILTDLFGDQYAVLRSSLPSTAVSPNGVAVDISSAGSTNNYRWMQQYDDAGKSVWTPVAPSSVWDAMSPEAQASAIQSLYTGSSPGMSAWSSSSSVTPSMIADTLRASGMSAFQNNDDLVNRAAMQLYYDLGLSTDVSAAFGLGDTAGMTPYQSAQMGLSTRQQDFAERQYADELAYQRQQAQIQQQQWAAEMAAQRRAQAMSLANSILGMQQDQWAQVAPYALPAGTQYTPGYEPNGAAAQMFAQYGLPFTPVQAVQTPGVDYGPAYQWAMGLLGG